MLRRYISGGKIHLVQHYVNLHIITEMRLCINK